MIDEQQLARFLMSPDAGKIIDILDRMVPEQRARVLGMLRSLKGGEHITPNPYAYPPGPKRRAARDAIAPAVMGRIREEKSVMAHQEGVMLNRETTPKWEARVKAHRKPVEPLSSASGTWAGLDEHPAHKAAQRASLTDIQQLVLELVKTKDHSASDLVKFSEAEGLGLTQKDIVGAIDKLDDLGMIVDAGHPRIQKWRAA